MPPTSSEHRAHRRIWRVGTPLVGGICGAMFVVSAVNSEGTDLRPGRISTLAELVRSETKNVESLQRRAQSIDSDVDRLAASVRDREVRRVRDRVRQLEPSAGYTEVTGEGIQVTMSDASRDVRETSDQESDLLVVHQQDVQAVVNAMWDAGADAVMIQGQRLITTTGIKCAGSSILLNGIYFPQPYVIEAVGDPDALIGAIDDSEYIDNYRYQSTLPDVAVGWSMTTQSDLTAPAYDGLRRLQHATPAS